MSGSNGMLESLPGGFVNQSKGREALLVLHTCAVLLIFVPVLEVIGFMGAGKNDLSLCDGEREIGVSLSEDSESGFV